MLQTSINTTQKYSQEMHYNYVGNSGFGCCTFTGKERDSETGFSYFGARYYDSDLMTGWLSVDPLADKYPSLSPYAYCGWNPVKLVDPDGREIIIHNMEWAKKIANDLNAIYKATYNIDQDAFAVQRVKDSKGNVYNRLVANKEFNWNLDKYTKAMKECIDDPIKVTIKIVKNENPDGPTLSRGRKVKDFIRDLGGGMIDGKIVYISEKLPTYSKENLTKGKFAKNHCLGGIVMHELLYHLHNVGKTDFYSSEETPTIMQSHYKIKRSNEHQAGANQVFPSNKKRK